MADASIPNFKTYAEGEPIPPVDPEDIKRFWKLKPPWSPGNDEQSACSPGADTAAVFRRWVMIDTLTTLNLLAPWQHGEELDDAVFRIAATFPLRELKHKSYMIPGDEYFGFDPNAFVRRLIEETGVSHVCELVSAKVPEGQQNFSFSSEEGPDPESEAKRKARQLLGEIWNRFANIDELLTHLDKEHASGVVAALFADFLIDNIDLVRQVESSFRAGNGGGPVDLLTELERKAQRRA